MEGELLFQFYKNRYFFYCVLLLCISGKNVAAKSYLPGESNLENIPEVTLSVGTILQNDIQTHNPLTLQEVEKLALENDSLTRKLDAESISLQEKGIAATSLPDPKLKIGLMNLPTDTFLLNQEPMTQQVIGLQQRFPSYGLLDSQGDQINFMRISKNHKATNQKQEVLRNVRKSWLDVYLQHHTGNIIKKSDELFSQLVKMTKSRYRSGRGNQQNLIRAQLERNLLKDTEIQVFATKEKALAKLGKWVDISHFNRPLYLDSLSIPELSDRDTLITSINTHSSLLASMASANAARKGIDIAKAKHYPSWMMDLSFSKREATPAGEKRADLLSIIFIVDIPLFTSNRQDKQVTASTKEYVSAKHSVDENRKNLKRILDSEYSTWLRLRERLQHYEEIVLPQASQNAKAALKAYRSQETEFDPLMRARLMELNIKLQALQIFVDLAQTQVNLLYLTEGLKHGSQNPAGI